ncbi:hypothetical protein [Zoogloea sp.]|uniref:hypothetical protein n=1 Tax=Zoogloea sp. TaxID=49181 RepID=UPI0035B3DAB9
MPRSISLKHARTADALTKLVTELENLRPALIDALLHGDETVRACIVSELPNLLYELHQLTRRLCPKR